MTELLGIVGSVSASSKTRTAVEVALNGAAALGEETDIIHLAEYDIDTADGRMLDQYEGDTATVLDVVIESDSYLIGTPIYRASYSGALKNLLDMVPRGQWQADVAPLENTAVGLVATGATAHHYLSVDMELRPVIAFFGARVTGSAYLHGDHFEDDEGYRLVDEEMEERLETLGAATVELARATDKGDALGSLGPQI